ncbi:MAG: hypothetical protein IIY71_00090, partial [Oscillospiraceae bacterium]|nr:hypothetical protein [Oscillospiraceae bacterium]
MSYTLQRRSKSDIIRRQKELLLLSSDFCRKKQKSRIVERQTSRGGWDMVFSSLEFLFLFLPLVLLAYFLMPDRGKNTVLFLFSLLFYAWGEP